MKLKIISYKDKSGAECEDFIGDIMEAEVLPEIIETSQINTPEPATPSRDPFIQKLEGNWMEKMKEYTSKKEIEELQKENFSLLQQIAGREAKLKAEEKLRLEIAKKWELAVDEKHYREKMVNNLTHEVNQRKANNKNLLEENIKHKAKIDELQYTVDRMKANATKKYFDQLERQRYDSIEATAINTINKLTQEVDELKKRIDKLKAEKTSAYFGQEERERWQRIESNAVKEDMKRREEIKGLQEKIAIYEKLYAPISEYVSAHWDIGIGESIAGKTLQILKDTYKERWEQGEKMSKLNAQIKSLEKIIDKKEVDLKYTRSNFESYAARWEPIERYIDKAYCTKPGESIADKALEILKDTSEDKEKISTLAKQVASWRDQAKAASQDCNYWRNRVNELSNGTNTDIPDF